MCYQPDYKENKTIQNIDMLTQFILETSIEFSGYHWRYNNLTVLDRNFYKCMKKGGF